MSARSSGRTSSSTARSRCHALSSESPHGVWTQYGELYALIAGDLILGETAKAKIVSDRWFKTDISKDFGWLFEPACLRYDGWELVDRWNQKGETLKTWAKTKPVVGTRPDSESFAGR